MTSDGGSLWVPVLQGSCQDVVSLSNGYVYAVGGYSNGIGYWVSTNRGGNWSQITNSGFLPHERTAITVCRDFPNNVYAVTVEYERDSPTGPRHANLYSYRSTDNGVNFTQRVIIATEATEPNWGMESDFLFVKVNPFDPSILFAGFGNGSRIEGLFLSTNSGVNWLNQGMGADLNCLAFDPNSQNAMVFVGYDQGIGQMPQTAGSFLPVSANLSIGELYRVTSDRNHSATIVGSITDGGFVRSTDGGSTWAMWGGGDGTNAIVSKFDPNVVISSLGIPWYDDIARTDNHPNLHYSSDGGQSFHRATHDGFWDGNEDWIGCIKEYPILPSKFFCPIRNDATSGDININISTDNGLSWQKTHGGTFVPIPTGDKCESPQHMSICEANPDIVYVSTVDFGIGDCANFAGSRLWRTINAGVNWNNLQVNSNGIPNRYISSVKTVLSNPDIVYLTLSGYDQNTPGYPGHVFESTNKGSTWMNISTDPYDNSWFLPDLPVNDMVVREVSSTQRELIVSTDAGVYHVLDGNPFVEYLHWQPLASGLPNSIAMGMDLGDLSLKLRVATFGRGIFETQLSGPIYVGNQLILQSYDNIVNIGDDILVGSQGTLKIPQNATVRIPSGKKITVQDGGTIDCSNGNPVTFTSQSGTWGGVEFQGNSTSTLSNCTFLNTSTPITIDNTNAMNLGHIEIDNCTFTNCGPVSINRSNVTVSGCTWNYSSAITGDVCGVSVTGSGSVIVQGNTINYAASSNHMTGVSVVQSTTTSVTSNIIRNASIGIFASNSDPNIRFNNIGVNGSTSADVGIGLDNCPNAYVLYDTIDSYATGISLLNGSSAVLHDNKVTNSSQYAMFCNNSANPRLTPTIEGGVIYWDAGLNILKTTTNSGDGIWLSNYSTPVLAEGYNTIWGGSCYLNGSGSGKWAVTDNCWVDDPPNGSKYCVTGFSRLTTTPYSCTPPAGAAGLSSENPEPPQPLVVYYGNGVYDTLKAANSNLVLNADYALYYQGVKKALQSDFTGAVNTFKQVVQGYPDSTSAVESLKKMYYCYGRMNADTTAYADLRSYYLGLSSQDTSFNKTANELSRKCLVRKLELEHAITEYEDVVQHSTSHSDSVSAEINIIEVYMLMQNHGGLARFTGRLGYLKPSNTMEGLRMIKDKLYNLGSLTNHIDIPKTFSLSQNYPNPFNPTTKIKYALPSAVKVTVKVYDILGRLVATLVNNEFKDAGYYEILFDANNLASGVYFYRIEAGKFVQSKKMVVLK